MSLYGLLGEKLGHSQSPTIHSIIFHHLKLENEYKLFEVDKNNLDEFFSTVKNEDIKGFNVTIPYKEECMKYLDYISDEAKDIGAVNTVINNDGKLTGYNTDYFGFGYLLRDNNIDIEGKIAVILGTGGASKALSSYLLDNSIKTLYMVSRNPSLISCLKNEKVKYITYEELVDVKGDLIINSTPVGMYPNENNVPVSKEIINNFNTVVDIICKPKETIFLRYGKELNKKVVGGLLMLVGQGVKAEEIWQNQKISDSLSRKIYNELLKEFL